MIDLIKKHREKIQQFNKERIFWLKISGFVSITIPCLLIIWIIYDPGDYFWLIIAGGLVLSICWWYWTMRIIRELLEHRIIELHTLKQIAKNIDDVKNTLDNKDN